MIDGCRTDIERILFYVSYTDHELRSADDASYSPGRIVAQSAEWS